MNNKNEQNLIAFFHLLRAGLWEKDVRLAPFGDVNHDKLMHLAKEQSVVGLVTAGLEHVIDMNVPKEIVLQFVGQALQLEQRNLAMNHFVTVLIKQLRENGIYTLLLKGQGIAQCYERPYWRASGDVDLFLDETNYNKAKVFLSHYSTLLEKENKYLHLGMTVDGWPVEIHGTLRSGALRKMDAIIDEVQDGTFKMGQVRAWRYEGTDIFLPEQNNDIVFIFTHIIKHFFHEGIGLRQICDWCRLLWSFKDSIDRPLLEKRIRSMGLMSEWRVFSEFAVRHLGMPVNAIPFYDDSKKWKKKADRLMSFIIMTGNFGHNRDLSYYGKEPLIKRKTKSFIRHSSDTIKRLMIFPVDTIVVWMRMFVSGIKALV